jgi:Fe-S-cluster containining protein
MKTGLAREVYAQIDTEWQVAVREYERQTGTPFPCGPGCADCCQASDATGTFREMPLSEAGAALLWETLVVLPPEVKVLLMERERTYYTATCILLSSRGLCLAYEGRSLWCRTWGLSGLTTCGKVKRVHIERWSEAVREAHAKLRGNGAFVPLREVIKRLGEIER